MAPMRTRGQRSGVAMTPSELADYAAVAKASGLRVLKIGDVLMEFWPERPEVVPMGDVIPERSKPVDPYDPNTPWNEAKGAVGG